MKQELDNINVCLDTCCHLGSEQSQRQLKQDPSREFTVKQSLGLIMVHSGGAAAFAKDKLKQLAIYGKPSPGKEFLFCDDCKVQCNSELQYEVHVMSQKHKTRVAELTNPKQLALEEVKTDSYERALVPAVDENNNIVVAVTPEETKPKKYIEGDYSIAHAYNIDAEKYLLPDSKRLGKYEKFGYYCGKCDAYMTGQIQLVMHVKGVKHQFVSPGELPNYQPSKQYNPFARCGYNKGRARRAILDPAAASTTTATPISAEKPWGFNQSYHKNHHHNHQRYNNSQGFEQSHQFQQHQQHSYDTTLGGNGGGYGFTQKSMHKQFMYCSNSQLLNAINRTPGRASSIEYMKRIFDSKYAATEHQFNQLYPGRFQQQNPQQQQQQPQTPLFFHQQSPRTPSMHTRFSTSTHFMPQHSQSSPMQPQFFNFGHLGTYNAAYGSSGGNANVSFGKSVYTSVNNMTQTGSATSGYPSVPSTPVNPNAGFAFFATPYQSPQQQPMAYGPQHFIYATPVQQQQQHATTAHFTAYNNDQNNVASSGDSSLDTSLNNQSYGSYEQPQSQQQLAPPPTYSESTTHGTAASKYNGPKMVSEQRAVDLSSSSSPAQFHQQIQHTHHPVVYGSYGPIVYNSDQQRAVLPHEYYQSQQHVQQSQVPNQQQQGYSGYAC